MRHYCPLFFYNDTAPPGIYTFPTRRSSDLRGASCARARRVPGMGARAVVGGWTPRLSAIRRRLSRRPQAQLHWTRSEEHTSELQSRGHLVCRLLLEKKNQQTPTCLTRRPLT